MIAEVLGVDTTEEEKETREDIISQCRKFFGRWGNYSCLGADATHTFGPYERKCNRIKKGS